MPDVFQSDMALLFFILPQHAHESHHNWAHRFTTTKASIDIDKEKPG
ncbi:MAG TPA: hypothetical protein VN902_04170 [Candidatus Acidoferrales bacterium]|jgi:hypothetical protein|nr:hypothetical protein [Candidatus Acidoferrales bacterium]